LDTIELSSGISIGPRATWVGAGLFVGVLLFILLGYKELFLTTFDPAYAASIGISFTLWHYLLMGMVSFTTVASFESIGAILVVAFLIAPPATAYLLATKLSTMLFYSVLVGVFSSIGGYYLAALLDASIAGGMATVAGAFFIVALLFSPTQGIIMKKFRTKPSFV